MASPKDPTTPPTPPPVIGKIGPYTVFLTPPPTPTPKPSSSTSAAAQAPSPSPTNVVAQPPPASLRPPPVHLQPPPASPRPPPVHLQPPPASPRPPPVQPPPAQYMNPSHDRTGFLWDAIAKLQNAHSSLDECVANWLGLNQSKYQWALDDYYEAKGLEKGDAKAEGVSSKAQCV
ncbi:hypothetical protein Dimus_002417 [Dionaea muscipula]